MLKKIAIRLVLVLSLLYVSLLAAIFFLQEQILFHPSAKDWDDCPEMVVKDGKDFDLKNNGRIIRGWYLENKKSTARVYIFHGNRGRACNEVWSKLIGDDSLEYISIEYPGYDGSPVSYENLLERGTDVYDYFHGKNPLPSIAVGNSLGTGLATYLTATRKISGLILISAYSSITDIVSSRFPFVPAHMLVKYPIPAEKWARKVKVPVLRYHGDADTTIPLEIGDKLADSFEKIESHEVKNVGHAFADEIFRHKNEVRRFVENILKTSE